MSEYIEREAAKKEFCLYFGGVSHAAIAVRLLDEMPSADVAPIRHARWKRDKKFNPYCTACGKDPLTAIRPEGNVNYCPNCGATMDLEE